RRIHGYPRLRLLDGERADAAPRPPPPERVRPRPREPLLCPLGLRPRSPLPRHGGGRGFPGDRGRGLPLDGGEGSARSSPRGAAGSARADPAPEGGGATAFLPTL